ncbi:hypothetical protein [Streptomyces sp. NBC_00425]|uniref:hypothetical protein n=1 Tax=Streptomyces sp. NBC_00425 TaxID=2975740 RepID=UPI002E1CD619
MTILNELIGELDTTAKRFRITTSQATELQTALGVDLADEEVTVTWQRVSDRVPSVLVTVPTGEDCWALPVPQRPEWLTELLVKQAPAWWLK